MSVYFITGGAGFLGCVLSRKLLAASNNTVVILDNFSFGKRENIDIGSPNFIVHEGDINDQPLVRKIIDEHKPDTVIHLAALHFIPYCNAHPLQTLRVNVEGTQTLLEACRNSSVKKILAASTAAVYPPGNVAHKETDPLAPLDIYGLSKMFMEHLINSFHDETAIACVNLRFFNIYGPYETNPHLIPRIVEEFQKKGNVIELGNLTPLRDYVYVEDMAEALITVAHADHLQKEVFNIGTGEEYAVTEIVQKLNQITGGNVEIRSVEKYRRKVDREHLLSDSSKIKAVIGWKPRFSIDEGLKQTALFYNLINQ